MRETFDTAKPCVAYTRIPARRAQFETTGDDRVASLIQKRYITLLRTSRTITCYESVIVLSEARREVLTKRIRDYRFSHVSRTDIFRYSDSTDK